jgi:hypothetical protein
MLALVQLAWFGACMMSLMYSLIFPQLLNLFNHVLCHATLYDLFCWLDLAIPMYTYGRLVVPLLVQKLREFLFLYPLTNIKLLQFGKDRALATYGVLPAVNVPPPYPLASISAVCFGTYGHRFATAASDGTVCTWQLEVGGRSNVHPTDSSLCFDNHALYVTIRSKLFGEKNNY